MQKISPLFLQKVTTFFSFFAAKFDFAGAPLFGGAWLSRFCCKISSFAPIHFRLDFGIGSSFRLDFNQQSSLSK
jgi:hypothetical protein